MKYPKCREELSKVVCRRCGGNTFNIYGFTKNSKKITIFECAKCHLLVFMQIPKHSSCEVIETT